MAVGGGLRWAARTGRGAQPSGGLQVSRVHLIDCTFEANWGHGIVLADGAWLTVDGRAAARVPLRPLLVFTPPAFLPPPPQWPRLFPPSWKGLGPCGLSGLPTTVCYSTVFGRALAPMASCPNDKQCA